MKKKGAFLAILLAGAMSLGVAGATGCKKNDVHTESEHVYSGEWIVSEANKPTASATGRATRSCTANDGGEQSILLPALTDSGYTITNDTATETATGTGTYTITIDGEVISFTAATPKKGAAHVHVGSGSWQVEEANKPTGTSTGLATRPCTANDGGVESKALPALSDSRYTVKATSTSGISRYTIIIDGVSISFTAATYVKPVDPSGEDEPQKPVVLSSDTAIALTAGETRELTGPGDNTTWTSDKQTVATVDSNGKVSAKTAGVAKIKAKSENSEIICTVIVQSPLSGGSAPVEKDPFNPTKTSIDIGSVDVSDAPVADPNATEYKVTFTDGVTMQYVAKDGYVIEPVGVDRDGQYLLGWKNGSASDYYDFNAPVQNNLSLQSVWGNLPAGVESVVGHEESISIEWTDSNAAGATVEYSAHGADDWKAIDSQLIRQVSSGDARADILGLAAGRYDVKVTPTAGGARTIENVKVNAYDRSGYAHFNYTEGIGAYKDDGTLKDNALVIYVTDDNKDTVMKDLGNAVVQAQMFDIPYYAGVSGATTNWNKKAEGIGWWLNNVQYTKKDKNGNVNSNTFSANGSQLGFGNSAFDNIPILIRFIGKVTTPEGCTAYDALGEGGSVGDNGHMARMKNLKNITLEGVGDDAEIFGWGFHFMAGSDAKNGRGKGFEVRNLTFNEYPEDAVGMEGVQSNGKITGSVERCWIHNNTFLPGRCDNPAESDKKEGDGSCDFKRGMYFTCSYNYFEYCHKTNLVGSADDSLQYNMTYHHNIWYQCGSRIPLTRQANVHFYNNYIFGDPAETSTPYSHIAKPSLSYVHSLRANCYLFSEANYYEGCKNVTDGKSGGAAKAYNNTFYSCSDGGTATLTLVDSREQTVSNNCEYDGTSYRTFDTDKNLFYYDSTNKKTDALLDDSVGARIRAVLYSGAQGHYNVTAKLQQMNTSPAGNTTSITSPVKGKGQVVTFSAVANTTLTIDATGVDPQVIRSDGKMYIEPFSGSKTVILDAGTYMVCSGIKSKEITINKMSVQEDTEAAKQARIEEARIAIQNIPASVTRNSGAVIEQAVSAYANLITQSGRDELGAELTERLKRAQVAYEEILVSYAIDRINYIGTVTEYSGRDIELAAAAYKAVNAASQSKVTNYNKLVAAQNEFAKFAVQNVQGEINRLPAVTDFPSIIDSKPAIELALEIFNRAFDSYSELDEVDKANVTVTGVSEAIATLTAALKPFDVKELIANLPESTAPDYISKAGALKSAYEALTAAQKEMITADEKAIYDAAVAKYTEFASKAVSITFLDGKPSDAAVIKHTGQKQSAKKTEFIVNAYSTTEKLKTGLKLESSTELTLTLATKMTVSFYLLDFNTTNTIAVNGQAVELKQVGGDNVATITLEAGTYKIARAKSENSLYYMTLIPA